MLSDKPRAVLDTRPAPIEHAPGPRPAGTGFRDLRAVAEEAFRDRWRTRGS